MFHPSKEHLMFRSFTGVTVCVALVALCGAMTFGDNDEAGKPPADGDAVVEIVAETAGEHPANVAELEVELDAARQALEAARFEVAPVQVLIDTDTAERSLIFDDLRLGDQARVEGASLMIAAEGHDRAPPVIARLMGGGLVNDPEARDALKNLIGRLEDEAAGMHKEGNQDGADRKRQAARALRALLEGGPAPHIARFPGMPRAGRQVVGIAAARVDEREAAEIKGRLGDLRAQMRGLEEKLRRAENDDQRHEIEGMMEKTRAQIRELEERVASRKVEVRVFDRPEVGFRARVERLDDREAAEIKGRLGDLHAQMRGLEEKLRHADTEEQRRELQGAAEKTRGQIRELEERIGGARGEVRVFSFREDDRRGERRGPEGHPGPEGRPHDGPPRGEPRDRPPHREGAGPGDRPRDHHEEPGHHERREGEPGHPRGPDGAPRFEAGREGPQRMVFRAQARATEAKVQALRHAAEALERAGMHDQARHLLEQAEHAQREMAEHQRREPRRVEERRIDVIRVAPGADVVHFHGEGPGELHRSIKELHEQVQALRKEVAEIREILQQRR